MSEKLRVVFNSPQCGWMSFELSAGAERLTHAVSSALPDALRELMDALTTLLSEDTEATLKWTLDPDELDFNLSAHGAQAALAVDWYQDRRRGANTGERVFSFQGSRLDVCRPFWRALKGIREDIEVDDFARNWRRPFPEAEMRRLSEALREYEQKQPASVVQPMP